MAITDVLCDGAWDGRPCFIVGGGPSLRGFDWSRLDGELVIAINRAFEHLPRATMVLSMDWRWWQWTTTGKLGEDAQQAYADFPGMKVQVDTAGHYYPPDIYAVRHYKNGTGLSPSLADGVASADNSGYGALGMALVLGCDPIYLLGFDMTGADGHIAHFHDGYPCLPKQQKATVYDKFRVCYEDNADAIRSLSRVVNVNPDSALRCFEFGDLPERVRRPVLVSFATYGNDGDYIERARALKRSCFRRGVDHYIETVASKGAWATNCQHKTDFIAECFERFPGRALLWVDADAEICAPLSLFDDLSGPSFACHYLSRNGRANDPAGREVLSGTLWFAGDDASRALVALWQRENAADPTAWDQRTLEKAVAVWGGETMALPPEYCRIFDHKTQGGAEHPVIVHHQASRELRRAGTIGQVQISLAPGCVGVLGMRERTA